MKAGVAAAVVSLALLGGPTSATAVVAAPASGDPCAGNVGTSSAKVREHASADDVGGLSLAQQRSFERSLHRRVSDLRQSGVDVRQLPPGSVRIDTYVHVIQRSDGTGGVSRDRINRQMRVLNNGYAGRTAQGAADTAFRFRIAEVDRTDSTDLYNWRFQDDDKRAKRRLHQGTRADLNIYIASLRGGLLGYAFYPNTTKLYRDGLVILNASMPGGSAAPYNRGDTATHEVGHWLGLYHTFEHGCRHRGDRVGDTPRQDNGNNIFRCGEDLNTCPARGGDPVHNFMSYGTDPCLLRFTDGQSRRMSKVWLAKRAPMEARSTG